MHIHDCIFFFYSMRNKGWEKKKERKKGTPCSGSGDALKFELGYSYGVLEHMGKRTRVLLQTPEFQS